MKTITLTLTKQLEDKFTSKLKKDKLTDSVQKTDELGHQ
jgi:hypothetical protein